MSTGFWYLLLLPVLAVAYVVWSYRKKVVAKDAASRERMAMLVGVTQAARSAGTTSGKAFPEPATASPQGRAVAAPAVSSRRFLSQPATLAYYVLKAGLPDYEVFPQVSLTAVVPRTSASPPAGEVLKEQQNLDFVICDKMMQVVAAVQLHSQPSAQFMALRQRLGTAGIRLIRLDPAALPRREQVRALIFGEST